VPDPALEPQGDGQRRVPTASAAGPALPSLLKDNCIGKQNRKSRFVAQENIRLYIERCGINNTGVLTITTPDSCLNAFQFQKKWHSLRTNQLKKLFPTGMWTRERQPRSGNWHAHCVVDLGRDIKTAFPFGEVQRHIYRNVDPDLRRLWKELREKGTAHGFGRIELLPIKRSGPGAARYLTKYLGAALGSVKSVGEEKCRLFGVWGGVRFVHSRFSWVSSRMFRRRKAWLAEHAGVVNEEGFRNLYGPLWWFLIGEVLLNVILPIEYYQVLRNGKLEWDDYGWEAYVSDLAKYPNYPSDGDRQRESLFRFYYREGEIFYRDSKQALRYAIGRLGYLEREGWIFDPQLILELDGAINRTATNP
jgi:hypothetical protein